jgi:hypothetical protein
MSGSGGSGGSMSGTGGSMSGTGGSGAGGSGTPGGMVTIGPDDMIDDMEDGDDAIIMLSKRAGFWYAYNDMTGGMQKPEPDKDFIPEDCGPSMKGKCVHITGSGFKEWGAGVGFDLNNPGEPAKRMTYDVSGFKGIAFWAKGNVPFRLAVAVAGVVPVEEGGTCPTPANPMGPEQCHDTHGKLIRVTGEWAQYVVPFSDLVQANFGKKAAFDPATVLSVQFDVNQGLTFDISIDEIGLYK